MWNELVKLFKAQTEGYQLFYLSIVVLILGSLFTSIRSIIMWAYKKYFTLQPYSSVEYELMKKFVEEWDSVTYYFGISEETERKTVFLHFSGINKRQYFKEHVEEFLNLPVCFTSQLYPGGKVLDLTNNRLFPNDILKKFPKLNPSHYRLTAATPECVYIRKRGDKEEPKFNCIPEWFQTFGDFYKELSNLDKYIEEVVIPKLNLTT